MLRRPKRHLALLFAVCLGLLAVEAGINYRVDPAALFLENQIEEAIARDVVAGHDLVVYGNINERQFQRLRLKATTGQPAYLVLGSSRSLLIGEWLTGQPTVNAAVPGATLEDVLAIAAMADHLHAGTVVLGIDPWMLNRNNNQQSWQLLRAEYQQALALIGQAPTDQLERGSAAHPLARYAQLINFDYLRESFKQIRRQKEERREDLRYEVARGPAPPPGAGYLHRDGSRFYIGHGPDRERRADALHEKLTKRGDDQERPFGLNNYVTVDPDLFARLAALSGYLGSRGKVVFFLPPYHPTAWQKIERIEAVREAESRLRQFAAQRGIRVLGGYDPANSGCTAREFADYFHPHELCMTRLWSAKP